MTRQEFVAAQARLLLRVQYQTIASLAVAILATIPNIPLFVHRQDFPPLVRLAALLTPLVIGLGGPMLFRHRAAAKARRLGIVCPKCGENFLWSEPVGGRCSNCRTVVFSEASNKASAAALPSKMDFHDRMIAFDRADPIYFAFGIPLGTMAGLTLLDLLRRQLGITEARWMAWAFMIVLFLALFVAPLFYKLRLEVLADRLGLCCPGCYQRVVGSEFEDPMTWYTLRTRTCPRCDSPVIN